MAVSSEFVGIGFRHAALAGIQRQALPGSFFGVFFAWLVRAITAENARREVRDMKAYQFQQHGGPEVLQWNDIPLPEPGVGEVRIRHTAVALNFRDILVRRGQHSVKAFPSGLGT
jgi:hypothetical protein